MHITLSSTKQAWILFLIFFAMVSFHTTASAKKCQPGYYGILECKPCPENTYAYQDHLLTSLGCKKCAWPTPSSLKGSRKCYAETCLAGTVSSGRSGISFVRTKLGETSVCIPSKGKHFKNINGKCTAVKNCAPKGCSEKINLDNKLQRVDKVIQLAHNEGYHWKGNSIVGKYWKQCRYGEMFRSTSQPANFKQHPGAMGGSR